MAGPGVVPRGLTAAGLTLAFATVPSRVTISDGSGNVTLILPPGKTTYQLNASTASGNRSVSLPTSATSTHVITVTAQSGDVTIRN